MTFPTKADIEFFKEAKRIQELWEPYLGPTFGRGDFYWRDGEVCIVERHRFRWFEEDIWLPRSGQLIEMLEERGYNIKTCTLVLDQSEYKTKASVWPKKGDLIDTFGPTPSIALGKCLLEVLGKEKDLAAADWGLCGCCANIASRKEDK